MEPEKKIVRLEALDGLRGIAILLVALSHINLSILESKGSNPLLQLIFDSGELGVSLLFILSGFLMTVLYPNPKSRIDFLQKRYTRIFPAFITVCLFISLTFLFPTLILNPLLSISVLIALSTVTFLIWKLIKKLNRNNKRLIFLGFLLLQIFSAGYYLFWILPHPATDYTSPHPSLITLFNTTLINVTLTLPFGTYIILLSSVFWSLAAEIYFYLLYPFVIVPLVSFLRTKNKLTKLLFLISTLPFFMALHILANHILLFRLLHIDLCFYFVGGITLGYLYQTKKLYRFWNTNIFTSERNTTGANSWITRGQALLLQLATKTSPLLFIFTILIMQFFLRQTDPTNWPLIKMLFAIPISFILLFALYENSSFAKILKTRILVFFGTISYSLYLIHLTIYEILKFSLGDPQQLPMIILYIVLALTVAITVATVLFYLLEKPYFTRSEDSLTRSEALLTRSEGFVKKEHNAKTKITDQLIQFQFLNKTAEKLINPKLLLLMISSLLFLLTFFNLNSNFRFFSFQTNYGREAVIHPTHLGERKQNYLSNQPIMVEVKADHNELSVVEVNLNKVIHYERPFNSQSIIFKIKEAGAEKWFQVNTYPFETKDDVIPTLFGFVPIQNSSDKTYQIELSAINSDSSLQPFIDSDNIRITEHYVISRGQLLKNPIQIINFMAAKIQSFINNPDAIKIMILFSPFYLLALYLGFSNTRLKKYL
jgi:peptidoglycan/LPS O-acetylase OafA/YrhL